MRRGASTHPREEAYPGLERIHRSQPVETLQSVLLERLQRFVEEVTLTLSKRIPEAVAGD